MFLSALLDYMTSLFCSKLNRAHVEIEDSIQESKERDPATPIKLDAAAHVHIEKHRCVTTTPQNCDLSL